MVKFYGIHGENEQYMGPFAKYLEKYRIIFHYIMFGTPEQNYVVERRSHTLMDMIKFMTSQTKLPDFL